MQTCITVLLSQFKFSGLLLPKVKVILINKEKDKAKKKL